MIINVPINLDERVFEEKVQQEYDILLKKYLIEIVEKTLIREAGYTWRENTPKEGMIAVIKRKVDDIVKEYKDDIIEAAADNLAKRLARTKKAKEILDAKDNT